MIFPPIKIIEASHQEATNGPMGVSITTGTRYFAATLLQEVYEGRRYMLWFWLPAALIVALAAILGTISLGLASGLWMILAGRQIVPLRSMRDRRELMGQAIEIAAIKLFYGREDMDMEYRLQARSMIIDSSSYAKKGMWPDIPKIDRTQIRWDDDNASIEAMVTLLKSVAPDAERYVRKNMGRLQKWRPLGAESLGY